jgi:hypothetical protein
MVKPASMTCNTEGAAHNQLPCGHQQGTSTKPFMALALPWSWGVMRLTISAEQR